MSNLSVFKYLANDWAKSINMHNINFNGSSFALKIDDYLNINFGYVERINQVMIVAYFYDIARYDELYLYKQLLHGNFAFSLSGEGCLGICPDNKQITFSVRSSLSGLDVKMFNSLFNHIIDVVENWKDILKTM